MQKFQVVHVIPSNIKNGIRSVIGTTVLNENLYVARMKAGQIEVYDTKEGFALTSQIAVAGMKDPTCLEACQRNNCLYIGHSGRLAWIHRLNLSTSQLTQWSVEGQPRAFSITKESNLLVTLRSANKVCEFTPSGRILREVKLDSSIDRPLHAIKLPNGQFLVSHSGSDEDRVCVVGIRLDKSFTSTADFRARLMTS